MISSFKSNLVVGYHGCDLQTFQALLLNPDNVRLSRKPYNWLGNGVYFWENDPKRALMWAQEKQKRGLIKEPCVIGAVLNLQHCLDLMDSRFITMFATYCKMFASENINAKIPIAQNKNPEGMPGNDKVLRKFDYSLIEYMHKMLDIQQKAQIAHYTFSNIRTFDSARAAFMEGEPVIKGSSFYDKTHVQICIRNTECIKGFFKPREDTRQQEEILRTYSVSDN
ncbi:hypothetical protein [Chitinophaga solisilvae]|uniref:hypothetical protein n=1 Tax=Chitinophaga solisilvae TaxID=1233460 RepID=UPI00136A7D58|nr:hypothetical protein [Chitinophaga solisilvae]